MAKRLFLGLELPAVCRETLAQLDPHLPRVRWGRTDQVHLTLSVLTVQTHLHSIFSKINVKTRAAAVRFVFEHNLG